MHEEGAYTVFFAFGIIWIGMGTAAVIALLKSDNQPIRIGKWGLLVTLSIIIPFVTALAIAWLIS
jgi:hypothetical protein